MARYRIRGPLMVAAPGPVPGRPDPPAEAARIDGIPHPRGRMPPPRPSAGIPGHRVPVTVAAPGPTPSFTCPTRTGRTRTLRSTRTRRAGGRAAGTRAAMMRSAVTPGGVIPSGATPGAGWLAAWTRNPPTRAPRDPGTRDRALPRRPGPATGPCPPPAPATGPRATPTLVNGSRVTRRPATAPCATQTPAGQAPATGPSRRRGLAATGPCARRVSRNLRLCRIPARDRSALPRLGPDQAGADRATAKGATTGRTGPGRTRAERTGAGQGRRRRPSAPDGPSWRWGELSGGRGTLIILAAAVIGTGVTVAMHHDPGYLLGGAIIVGTLAAALAVRTGRRLPAHPCPGAGLPGGCARRGAAPPAECRAVPFRARRQRDAVGRGRVRHDGRRHRAGRRGHRHPLADEPARGQPGTSRDREPEPLASDRPTSRTVFPSGPDTGSWRARPRRPGRTPGPSRRPGRGRRSPWRGASGPRGVTRPRRRSHFPGLKSPSRAHPGRGPGRRPGPIRRGRTLRHGPGRRRSARPAT